MTVGKRRRWTEEDQKIAEELRAAGWSCGKIAMAFKWPPSAVRSRLNPPPERTTATAVPSHAIAVRDSGSRHLAESVGLFMRAHYERKDFLRQRRNDSVSQLSPGRRKHRFALFYDACAYCGAVDNLQTDHVLALSEGGGCHECNVVPACRRCNSSKWTRPVEQWYRSQPFFSEARWDRIRLCCPEELRRW
jgi:5-methylcytosine-specific restriction endonuclease McrA